MDRTVQGTSRHVHSSGPTSIRVGSRCRKTCINRCSGTRSLSISLSWLRCIEPRTPPVSFLLEISKKLWLQIEKISASYRYAFRFQSSLSKRFDFFSPTLLHQLTSFSLLLALLLSLFLRCSCFFTLKPTFLPHSLRCALSKVHC